MVITILTLFPEMCLGPLSYSIVGRAQKKHLLTLHTVNIRDFATDKYRSVDDRPYGGGGGMILKVDVLDRALTHAKSLAPGQSSYSVLMDPKGKLFDQQLAKEYSLKSHLIIVCGHYEGIDVRVNQLVDEVVSVGKFVLTGGEIPATLITDCVTRLLPGVLRKEALESESFTSDELEAPQYTRPNSYKNMQVPSVLIKGNHANIALWKKTNVKKIPG